MLTRTWKYGETRLFRAEKLYTAQNYQTFIKAFRQSFPDYVYYDPLRGKELISAPLSSIKTIFVPRDCLIALKKMRKPDELQKMALDLLALVSKQAGICLEDFGIHGSIALNMHAPESDIDFVIYGSQNFRVVEQAIAELANAGKLSYIAGNRLDAARKFQGKYCGKIFMYNATRKPEEAKNEYGMFRFSPIAPVRFKSTVSDDTENMYRPAMYKINDYRPLDPASELQPEKIPDRIISNIGCYRNIARKGSEIKVAGQLEHVEPVENRKDFYQVVVGTATLEEEYIWPV